MTTDARVIPPDDSQPPSRERFGAPGSHSRGAGGPGDMNDEVARLVRSADASGPIAPLTKPGSHVYAPRCTARGARSTSPAKPAR